MTESVNGTPVDSPVPETDLFDRIVRQLFSDTALVTAPGSLDPRWPVLIAQAYRDGIANFVAQSPGGFLLKMEQGGLAIYQIDAQVLEAPGSVTPQ